MKRNVNKSFENFCAIFLLFSPLIFRNALLILFISLALLSLGLANLFKNNSLKRNT